jgi:hydroxymethylbilane synthase
MINVGARSSPLSKVQVQEVYQALQKIHPSIVFIPHFASSPGDRDQKTSLRNLGSTDFFTKDLDDLLLQGRIDIAIHSAKDLPDPLRDGLEVIAITKGVDPRDSLVYNKEPFVENLLIGASSQRREAEMKKILPKARFVDVRGTIEERLFLLDQEKVDALIMAEAALIRLKMTLRKRIVLPFPTPPLQGRLAIVSLATSPYKALFAPLHWTANRLLSQLNIHAKTPRCKDAKKIEKSLKF